MRNHNFKLKFVQLLPVLLGLQYFGYVFRPVSKSPSSDMLSFIHPATSTELTSSSAHITYI